VPGTLLRAVANALADSDRGLLTADKYDAKTEVSVSTPTNLPLVDETRMHRDQPTINSRLAGVEPESTYLLLAQHAPAEYYRVTDVVRRYGGNADRDRGERYTCCGCRCRCGRRRHSRDRRLDYNRRRNNLVRTSSLRARAASQAGQTDCGQRRDEHTKGHQFSSLHMYLLSWSVKDAVLLTLSPYCGWDSLLNIVRI